MKQEIKIHLFPLLGLFIIISLFWFFSKVPNINILLLFLGFVFGAFLLDIDHFIYWLYLKPNTDESRLAQSYLKQKDIKSTLKLFEKTHKTHLNLIFHHYFFQVILALITLFVFTSTTSIFTKSLLLALNLHLLIDETNDFYTDKKMLQKWLFAREAKQLSAEYLKYYLIIFIVLLFTFTLLLLESLL